MLIPPLKEETSSEAKHSYYAAALNLARKALQIEDEAQLKQALKEVEAWAQDQIDKIMAEGKGEILANAEPRFYWQSADWGHVWLDDKIAEIAGKKYALYWKLGVDDLVTVLPPSCPFFVGNVGEIIELPFCGKNCYAHVLYRFITRRAFKGQPASDFLKSLKKILILRKQKLGGKFYLDYKDTPDGKIWSVHWNRRHRELVTDGEEFLLEVIANIEKIAKLQTTCDRVWEWLDSHEESFCIKSKLEGKCLTLKCYPEGVSDTIGWHLRYNRQKQRIPRHRVGSVHRAIKEQSFLEPEILKLASLPKLSFDGA